MEEGLSQENCLRLALWLRCGFCQITLTSCWINEKDLEEQQDQLKSKDATVQVSNFVNRPLQCKAVATNSNVVENSTAICYEWTSVHFTTSTILRGSWFQVGARLAEDKLARCSQ